MPFDFDRHVDRHQYQEIKWECPETELPMWIADMDFVVAPRILDAMSRRVAQGTFGYTEPGEDWYKAYQDFYAERHHLTLERSWLVFCLGVVPTISSTVRKLTDVGDNVVILTPVYNIFFNSIINNRRNVVQVPLVYDGSAYTIDWPALETAFRDPKTKLMIFCNPHNPVSRLWTREELDRLGRLAYENHVVVLSDEIHSEIVRPGKEYLPFIAANDINKEITVMAVSPTKTFSVPGIQTSAIVIPNPELRRKVVRQINTDEVAEPNSFSCPVAIAALRDSRDWLDAMRQYVFRNRDFVQDYVRDEIPQLTVLDGDATYLLWIDISRLNTDADTFQAFLRQKTGLNLASGRIYGKGGEQFLRMNVATQMSLVQDGVSRLKEGVKAFLARKP